MAVIWNTYNISLAPFHFPLLLLCMSGELAAASCVAWTSLRIPWSLSVLELLHSFSSLPRPDSISTAVLKQCHIMNYLETFSYCLLLSVSFLTIALALWDKSEIGSIATAERKALAKWVLDVFAGPFRRFGWRGCNLINNKHHLSPSFAAAPGTKILILYFHVSLMLP